MPSPLNGTKTHPLSEHAKGVLGGILRCGPTPSNRINPGVVNRFHREGLTETVRLPSPFKTHQGSLIDHEQITEAGRAALSAAL